MVDFNDPAFWAQPSTAVEDDDEQEQPQVDYNSADFWSRPSRPVETPEPQPKVQPQVDYNSADFWSNPSKPAEVLAETPALDDSEYGFDTGKTLTKDDIKNDPNMVAALRQHMVNRNGVRYSKSDLVGDDEVVDDFIEHMRNFNTNIVSTAGEVRFISNATDEQKAVASEAYKIYDQLGNVFVNDGFFGAVDGIWDYVSAAATDPSNYIGLLTGGAAKAGAFGGSAAAKQLVRKAAAEAGRKAIKNGATRAAAEKAGQEAAEAALARFTAAGVKSKASQEAIQKIADLEKNIFLSQAKRKASQEVLGAAAEQRGRRALMATTASDALVAMGQDYEIQSLMMDVGVQEEYSVAQTGFSSLFGAVGGGLQLAFGKAAGASGLEGVSDTLGGTVRRQAAQDNVSNIIAKETALSKPLVDDEGMKKAAADIKTGIREWKDKWQRGLKLYANQTTEADLMERIVLGEGGKATKNGLVKVFKDLGVEYPKGATVSDVVTNVVKYLPQKELDEINQMLAGVNISLGDMTQAKVNLQDLVANEASRAGKTLNVFSRAKALIDVNVIKAHNLIETAAEGTLEREADKAKTMKGFQYGQNLWRRMLVSSPATTAVNVAGFSQYYIGSTLADVLTGTTTTLAGLASTGAKRAEYLRVGKVYRGMVAQKMRYLLDPYTTHDAYMKFLKENEDVSKVLFETVSGGVERTAQRYGMNPNSKWYQNAEKLANGVNKWTGVRVQDSFTKSQMFMSEMDKYLRINKGKTLQEVINGGDTSLIDNDVLGAALDGTMKSVFSKDYTGDDQLLAGVARLIETVSKTPLLGTVLPFGRFMNNVVATSYQWTAAGAVEAMKAIAMSEKRNLSTAEAFARTTVGWTGIGLAMHFDEERRQKGLAATEVEVGGGQVADMRNVYPFSAFLVAGRVGNLYLRGEMIPDELKDEALNQLAIGQVAKDAEFGNDLFSLLSFLSDSEDTRQASLDALYKQTGNILAGFTRPLDAINRAVGYINDSDIAKDTRQATGIKVLTQSASKYVDNIIEVFDNDIAAITGEELRVATREGPLQDANPAARIAGVTIKPPQNASEFVYAMSEMMPYTANMRSKDPVYDKIYNTLMAPQLKGLAEKLMDSPSFMKGDVATRREMLKSGFTNIRRDINEYMKEYTNDTSTAIAQMRKTALTKGSKEAQHSARKYMEKRGVKTTVKEMGYKELQEYIDYVDHFDKLWKDLR
jgi:hypothetical protein